MTSLDPPAQEPRRFAAGVDIGGTKVAVGLVDGSGTLLEPVVRFEIAELRRADELARRIAECVRRVAGDRVIEGVGIGSPGPLDLCHGVLLDEPTLPQLYGLDLVRQVREATGLPTWIENDADTALLGETWSGELHAARSVAMVTVGTGVGGAALVHGRLLRGHRGLHPEVGAMVAPAGWPTVVEDVVAGPALERLAQAARTTARELLRAAAGGDAAAAATLEPVHRTLRELVWNVLHAYAPQALILGGGVMQEHFALFAPELLAVARNGYMVGGAQLRLLPARLGNAAGIVGAARQVLEPELVRDGPPRDGSQRMPAIPCDDAEAMSARAAERVATVLREKPDALLCLATGDTPRTTYARLAELARRSPALFARVRVIELDEWSGIRPDCGSSCDSYLRQHVLGPWRVDPSRYTGFSVNPADAHDECRRIAGWLAANGPIDLALLGLGRSGHVGFNEPAETLTPGTHPARLLPETLAHPMVAGEAQEQVSGLTLGMGDLLRAREVLLLVAGAGKRALFAELQTGNVGPRLPASLLHLHPNAACLYDRTQVG